VTPADAHLPRWRATGPCSTHSSAPERRRLRRVTGMLLVLGSHSHRPWRLPHRSAAPQLMPSVDRLLGSAGRSRRRSRRRWRRKQLPEKRAMQLRSRLPSQVRGQWNLCMCVYFCAHITSHTRWRPCAPGARSSAAALLTAAADAQRQAREARAAAAERRLASLGISGGGSRGGDGTAGTSSTRHEPSATTGSEPKTDKVGAALARVLQACNSSQAAVLARVLANVASQPGEAKYRRLRLGNAKVAEAVVATGALAHLLVPYFGWTMEADDEGTPDAVAVQSAEAAEQHAQSMQQCAQRLLQL
jgi:PUB domain